MIYSFRYVHLKDDESGLSVRLFPLGCWRAVQFKGLDSSQAKLKPVDINHIRPGLRVVVSENVEALFVAAEVEQVWSLTQFHSVDFSK